MRNKKKGDKGVTSNSSLNFPKDRIDDGAIIPQAEFILPSTVRKRDGRLEDFSFEKLVDSIYSAAESVGGRDREEAKRVAIEALRILGETGVRTPTSDEIYSAAYKALKLREHHTTAHMFRYFEEKRKQVRELGTRGSSGYGNTTDSFLMVASTSNETAMLWDRNRIVESLVIEADIPPTIATKISKAVENRLALSEFKIVNTSLIRELAHEELLKRGFMNAANRYRNLGIPRYDLGTIIKTKNKENSNISSNNPEAVNYTVSGKILKEFALSGGVFSSDVAEAHSKGRIHIHNLEAPVRVYCSSHSLEYLKKYGLNLLNLQSSSSPAKHTRTLTGHLNTFLASMQAYYAGALGIGYMNIFYAPLIEADLEEIARGHIDFAKRKVIDNLKARADSLKPEVKESLEKIIEEEEKELEKLKSNYEEALIESEIESLIKQEEQYKEFSASQNAFSRGGQTLFLDFNMHTGVPSYLKNTLAVGPGGKYMMKRNGRRIFLEERKLEEKTPSGYNLIELTDPETQKVVMREKLVESEYGSIILVQESFLEEGEKLVTYGDYDKLAKRILKSAMKVWAKGDSKGAPFAFPKLDLHINEDTFKDSEQTELLKEACKMASDNGAPYFIFDRDEVTLSACCRLRTTLNDNYVLKHPEAMRFCGFLNVTINLPHAAYYAARKRKDKRFEAFLNEVDKSMDLAVKAHLEKRKFIEELQKPGLPQWQTGMPSMDGQPYIDLNKVTHIIGLIGLNEAMQVILGKELHEMTPEETENYALRTISHMNSKAKEFGEKYKLKFSLEETPAESASRRLAKSDLQRFRKAKKVIKGGSEPYYTNSIHFRADAPIDLITRIEGQSLYHPAIESGAIVHAFVGEHKPSPESIYSLVEKTFRNTQAAQITISPEFTICKTCDSTYRGLKDKCPNARDEEEHKIAHMTRIVGYYSIIEEWNPSKLSELNDRHKGDYSVGQPKTSEQIANSYGVPCLVGNDGKLTAVEIGKTNCKLCDKAYNVLERAKDWAKKTYNQDIEIMRYYGDTEDGMPKALISGLNLSRLPGIVFVRNGEVIGKFETRYENGKVTKDSVIGTPQVQEFLRNYFESSAKES